MVELVFLPAYKCKSEKARDLLSIQCGGDFLISIPFRLFTVKVSSRRRRLEDLTFEDGFQLHERIAGYVSCPPAPPQYEVCFFKQ